ncbi:tubulin cofactor B [Amylocarpus encephaloides]|uniref:Tubulin cofactor B n=1 Tax=Amylocarpus encephaloides TaxID=45428 RepID=A0A9P7YL10_9HELO|nr:tubulin cofactor B [Amylocarpus encephaloides]
MNMQSAADISLLVSSQNSSSERRITPSWTIGQLKAKLEPITGVPPLSQTLILKHGNQSTPIEAADEENTQLGSFPLAPYAEILVIDTRPPGARPNYTDPSAVKKFELAPDIYETKTDSVLAWKKANKLGRFDPDAPAVLAARINAHATTAAERGIEVGKRCRIGGEDEKRGEVMYLGEVEAIATKEGENGKGVWVGVKYDEPVGRNDGSLGGKRYWGQPGDGKFGAFVRPERVDVGDYPVLDDLDEEDMDEI